MGTKRAFTIFSSVLLVGIAVFLICLRIMSKPNPAFRLKAEQEIYSVLITGKYYIGNYVFESHTAYLAMEDIQYIKDEVPELESNTLIDFQENNRQSYLLKDYLTANTKYLFLDDVEVKQFYNDWEAFSNQHPNIRIINSFSRVGFNSSFTQAIVLINRNAKSFDGPFEYTGDGLVYLFKKIGGKWVEKYQLVFSITG